MRAFVVDEPHPGSLRALNYSPQLEKIRRAGSETARSLGSLISGIGGAFGTVFTRRDCAPEFGVQLLSQTDMFAAEPMGRTIRSDSMPNPNNHLVRRWQVLVAAAGQMDDGNLFGRSIIADSRLEGSYLGPDAVALTFEDPGSVANLWTSAYLNTPFGIAAMKTAAFGTSIPRLRIDLLRSLPVPMAAEEMMQRVADLMRVGVSNREDYYNFLQAARSLVEQMPEMQEAHEMCSLRSSHYLLWDGPLRSLCAWNVASSGGALRHLTEKWSRALGDVVEDGGIYKGHRFARVECVPPFGVDFMSQRDVMLVRPAPRRIRHPGFADRLLFAQDGTILVGAAGTLGEGEIFGRAILVHGKYASAAFTEHLLRVVPKDGEEHALYAYLTTTVGFRLLRTTAVGTKILSMRDDMLRSLPVPEWPSKLKQRVADLVRSAFASRAAADEAEANAIRIIEQEVLPQWLG